MARTEIESCGSKAHSRGNGRTRTDTGKGVMRQNKLQKERVQMKPQNEDAPCPSITLGVQTPKIFDGHTSVKYFGGVGLSNI